MNSPRSSIDGEATEKNIAKKNLGARILRAMGAQMVSQGLRIVQQILLVPFFLRTWGIDIYNDWLLLNAGVAFINIFDIGMQQFFSGLLHEQRVQGDIIGYRRAGKIAGFNYLVIILIAFTIIGLGSFIFPWLNFLGVKSLPAKNAYATLTVLALNTILLLPFGIAGSLYRANGEYDRGVVISSANLTLQITTSVILLLLDQPCVILALGLMACSLVGWAVVLIDQRVRYGPLPWGIAVPTIAELRGMATKCLYFMAQPLTTSLIIQGPILILGHFGSPSSTVAFATARTLVGVSRQLTLQLSYPFSVEMSVQLVRNEISALGRLLRNSVAIMGIIGGLLAGVTIVVAAPVMTLWLRGRVDVPSSLIIALVIPVVVTASAQLYQLILSLSNRPQLVAYGISGQAAIALFLSLILVQYYGATGVAIGLGIGEIVTNAFYIPSRMMKGIGMTGQPLSLLGIVKAGLACSLGFAIGEAVAVIIPLGDYAHIAMFGALWAVAAGIAAFFTLLNIEQRNAILRRLPKVRTPNRK